MKKFISIFILFVMSALVGCGAKPSKETTQTIPTAEQPEQQETTMPAAEETDSFPGTYMVPEGWVEAEKYSTEEKRFYVENGHEADEFPDNISINVGTNRYSTKEHEKFRKAIVNQLLMQIQGEDAQLYGDGTYTEQDYILYIMTIEEADVVTTQYYIVGDYQYCLVHLTNYSGSESADEAARAMVDSFVWENGN